MNILVITPRFALAGVPLAQFRFAEALAKEGHNVDFLVGFNEIGDKILRSNLVKIKILNKKHVRQMFFSIIKYLKINTPDIIFSAEDHLNILVLISAILTKSQAKISCSSRVTPYDTYINKNLVKGLLLRVLNKIFAYRANVLTCVSKGMVSQYKKIFPELDYKCVYNIVDSHSLNKTKEIKNEWLNNKYIKIISAGKLAEWKGFEYLIRSMVEVVSKYSNAKLLILGGGPLKEKLEKLILDLNLSNNVRLIGYVNNPLDYFKKSDIFVLSSLVEGMPNVLIEAMMSGCTVVSTNCETGPGEIIKNSKNGYLVPIKNTKKMSASIIYAIENPIPKSVLTETVKPFKASNVIQKHFKLLGLIS
jgi:glycosyltransferase involved in cell wall biosynthesis